MTKLIIAIAFGLTLMNSAVSAQLTTVRIENFGSIGLPKNMEIQGGAYKEITEKIKEVNGVSASKVIFQQKNLNKIDKSSFNTYARVFVRTQQGSNGEFKKLKEPLTVNEANEVNSEYKNQIEYEASANNAKILEWYKARVTKINNQNAITFGYKRQIGSNPPVKVETFMFQNYNKLHIVTFEYRIDENNWSATFTNIKSSIKIL